MLKVYDDRDREQDVREQPTAGRYRDVAGRLRAATAARGRTVAVFWNAELPEDDGGWQASERSAVEKTVDGREALAVFASQQVFRRPALGEGAPNHADPTESAVTSLLLGGGVRIVDLSIAALRAQPGLGKDEVYKRVRALLEGAEIAVEIAADPASDRIGVRIRDLAHARLLAVANVRRAIVLRDSRPADILGRALGTVDGGDHAAAVFAVAGVALIEALAAR